MANRCTRIPEIMLPQKGTDLSKWAVIACDQYTSQPEYWAETDRIVGDAPSTLRLTLPEVYLEEADVAAKPFIRPCAATLRRERCKRFPPALS